MKLNKAVTTVALASVSALALTACGSTYSSTKNQELAAKDYQSFLDYTAKEYSKYVNLGDYKSTTVATVDRASEEITDEAVNTEIENLLSEMQEDVTETATTQEGDTITLDYEGLKDGVAFEGGTSTDVEYIIGTGDKNTGSKYIDDLDKGLVGLTANKEVEIPVTFPEDYSSEDLAGKKAVFKVTIKKITRSAELTDKWVADNASKLELKGYGSNLKTVDALKEGVKAALNLTQKRNNDYTLLSEVIESVKAGESYELKAYPEEELNYYIDTIATNINNQYTSYGSMYGYESYEDYLKGMYNYSTEEEFKEGYCTDQAKTYLESKMITTIIANDNGVKVSAKDITSYGNELAVYYGYESYQALVEAYKDNPINAEMGYNVVQYKAGEALVGVIKEEASHTVSLTAVDDSGQTIQAVFEFVNKEKKNAVTITSSSYAIEGQLLEGTYTVKETKLDGYTPVKDFTLTVSKDGKITLGKDASGVKVKDNALTITNKKASAK